LARQTLPSLSFHAPPFHHGKPREPDFSFDDPSPCVDVSSLSLLVDVVFGCKRYNSGNDYGSPGIVWIYA
jgi:hypothetical protein